MDNQPNNNQSIEVLQVKIISPKETLFEGPALSVSSKNTVGKFDILPEHANFITVVKDEPIIIRQPNKPDVTFKFSFAVIYNNNNQVKIYTDIQLFFNPNQPTQNLNTS
ncbi:hypothetical protein HY385_00110 [Candidatus Daviesbacteria bacterium]|nr:hypothetical protein [Candidatus Daviesbacteria bacterium]